MTHKQTTSSDREQKRERFQANGSGTKGTKSVLIALVVVLAIGGVYLAFGSRKAAGIPGKDLSIPLTEITSEAKFYHYTLNDGKDIGFFVVKSSDSVIRAAFDACDVCYADRKGYQQEGDDMVCKKCGRHFPSKSVNDETGGCTPAALARVVEGDHLLIKGSDLARGTRYF